MSEIRVRVAEAPVRGARVAWSYLATVVGALLGGLFWAVWAPFGPSVCGDPDDVLCQLGWGTAGGILGAVLGLAVAAFVFRLGWEWWAVPAAVLLGAPLWFDAVPDAVRVLVVLLAPTLAAAATWTGPRRPAWRPWAIGGAALLLVVLGLASVLL
ncbi:MAG TPA: hypothetical protein GXZ45_11400 [Propionibacterium sp.]|nr:hypothetical protein [Propionibacterium sp.]